MMASVKYHFGMMRTAGRDHQQGGRCQDADSTHFSLEEDEDGYSTILGQNCNNAVANGNVGASSRLLATRGEGAANRRCEEGGRHQQQKKGGGGAPTANGTAKQKENGRKNGGGRGGLHLERSRGPSRMRTSPSLLTDEIVLNEEDEDELAGSHSGSDDEDDLLPAFSHLGNGTANVGTGTILLNSNGSIGNGGGGGPSGASWQNRLRRRLGVFGCCFPRGNGFTQFK